MGKGRHNRLVMLMSDVLLLSACCLFIVSMGTPFLKEFSDYAYVGAGRWERMPVYYWSFRASHSVNNRITQFDSFWFSTFNPDFYMPILGMQVPMLLIAMFLAQILTVVSGLFSLFLRKRWNRVLPFAHSLTVTLLMASMHNGLSMYKKVEYEIGYWLTYPPMLLFLLAFTTSLIAGKTRITDAEKLKRDSIS